MNNLKEECIRLKDIDRHILNQLFDMSVKAYKSGGFNIDSLIESADINYRFMYSVESYEQAEIYLMKSINYRMKRIKNNYCER